MPHYTPTVSFQLPVHSGSGENISYRTVHIVIIKSKPAEGPDVVEAIGGPFILVLIIALVILFIASKIKPGVKTDRILNTLEGFPNVSDSKTQGGKI